MAQTYKFVAASTQLPGISAYCKNIPGSSPPREGSHLFAANVGYVIDEETAGSLKEQYQAFSYHVQQILDFQFHEIAEIVEPSIESDEASIPDEPIALTDEDNELLMIEIAKIKGKSNAQAESIIVATFGNEDLPKVLRSEYLRLIAGDESLPKGVKAIAQGLLSQ